MCGRHRCLLDSSCELGLIHFASSSAHPPPSCCIWDSVSPLSSVPPGTFLSAQVFAIAQPHAHLPKHCNTSMPVYILTTGRIGYPATIEIATSPTGTIPALLQAAPPFLDIGSESLVGPLSLLHLLCTLWSILALTPRRYLRENLVVTCMESSVTPSVCQVSGYLWVSSDNRSISFSLAPVLPWKSMQRRSIALDLGLPADTKAMPPLITAAWGIIDRAFILELGRCEPRF